MTCPNLLENPHGFNGWTSAIPPSPGSLRAAVTFEAEDGVAWRWVQLTPKNLRFVQHLFEPLSFFFFFNRFYCYFLFYFSLLIVFFFLILFFIFGIYIVYTSSFFEYLLKYEWNFKRIVVIQALEGRRGF